MGERIELRDGDRLHGGRVELLVAEQGTGIPASCPAIIRRGTTKEPFLGPTGWQAVEYEFHPTEAYEEAGRLVLRFGPELVDNVLRDDDIVQIALPVLGVEDVIAWSGITRSVTVSEVPRPPGRDPLKGVAPPPTPKAGIALAAVADRSGWIGVTVTGGPALPEGQVVAFRREDGAAPVLGPAGWQADAHGFVAAAREGGTRLMLDLGAAAGSVPAGSPVEVALPGTDISARADWPALPGPVIAASPPARKHGWLLPVLALLLLAGSGWWWWSQQRVTPVPPVPCSDPASERCVPPPPVPEDAGKAAYDRAMAAIAADECTTARTEMLSAIDLDHGPALLSWAEAQDSLNFVPCLTETANDISALERYQQACAAEVEGAADGLRALVAELERQAEVGEGAAGDVLRLAVPKARDACGI